MTSSLQQKRSSAAYSNKPMTVEMRTKLQVQTAASAYKEKERENEEPRGELYWKDGRIEVLETRVEVAHKNVARST